MSVNLISSHVTCLGTTLKISKKSVVKLDKNGNGVIDLFITDDSGDDIVVGTISVSKFGLDLIESGKELETTSMVEFRKKLKTFTR